MKFRPGVKFSTSSRVGKINVTRGFQPGTKLIFFTSFHPGVKNICKDLQHILQKCFMGKHVSHAVTGLYKDYDGRIHQQEK